jgi:hypothetical protein
MVPHIAYDLMQLIEVAKSVPRGREAETVSENALIDAVLVYARKLLVFMDPPPKKYWREGDVYATDYVDTWAIPTSWWGEANREIMKTISTRAAHICLDRLTKVSWNTDAIAGSITDAMLSFLRQLDPPYLSVFERSV